MNDETNESIVVVSPSIAHNSSVSNNSDGDSIRVIRDPISHPTSMASKSVVTLNQESSEGFKLEAELNRMRSQLNQVKNENAILRQRLEAVSESSSRGLSASPKVTQQHLHTPDEFIDIGAYSIAEQIERYLAQTDTLYNDDIQLRPAMEYLIKKVWSIIAHEYDEKSLENSRKLRDSLLIKLNRTCETFSCVDMLENELERMKRDTFTLREKVIKQHELIKSLLTVSMQKRNESMVNGLPNSTQESFVNIASIKQQQQQQQQPIAIEHTNGKHEPENDEDETTSPSPSISPSASFSSHLDRLLNNENKRKEVRTIDTLSTIETTSMYSSANQQEDDSTLQHEEQQPMNTNATNDTTSEQQQQQQQPQQPQYPHQPQQQQPQQTRAPNDFILYGVNGGDYIGVGRTVEVDNSRLQNYLETPPTNNQQPTTSTRANANIISPSTGSAWFYQCPKCKTAIDPGKIRWEKFVEHMNSCDAENNNVCMFCLMSFPKDDNSDLFVEHVQSHFETEF